MGVFCDRLKLCSTAAPDCWTGQNKGRYCKQELSFLLLLLLIAKLLRQVIGEKKYIIAIFVHAMKNWM